MNSSNDWNITTDIYDIVESVDKLKKRYIMSAYYQFDKLN